MPLRSHSPAISEIDAISRSSRKRIRSECQRHSCNGTYRETKHMTRERRKWNKASKNDKKRAYATHPSSIFLYNLHFSDDRPTPIRHCRDCPFSPPAMLNRGFCCANSMFLSWPARPSLHPFESTLTCFPSIARSHARNKAKLTKSPPPAPLTKVHMPRT